MSLKWGFDKEDRLKAIREIQKHLKNLDHDIQNSSVDSKKILSASRKLDLVIKKHYAHC